LTFAPAFDTTNKQEIKTMGITATELHALAPLGASVTYSDGTKRPPERFKNKSRTWEGSNGSGYFTAANPDDARPRFTIMKEYGNTRLGPSLTVKCVFGLDCKLTFEVTPPTPGTILAYREFEGRVEVSHVWPTLADAHAWAHGFYKFETCGNRFWLVTDDGKLIDHMPANAAA
jgi:hypothetical protein